MRYWRTFFRFACLTHGTNIRASNVTLEIEELFFEETLLLRPVCLVIQLGHIVRLVTKKVFHNYPLTMEL